METEFTVEFYEEGKHCISFPVVAGSTLGAHDLGLGKLSDANWQLAQDGDEITYDEVRIIRGAR